MCMPQGAEKHVVAGAFSQSGAAFHEVDQGHGVGAFTGGEGGFVRIDECVEVG